MSRDQRIVWYVASLVFGLCVAWVAAESGAFADGAPTLVPAAIFGASWLAGVLVIRVFVQSLGDRPTLGDLFGLPAWLRRK
ncbi:hypothetical protein CKO37_23600 [Rubrivivax gelatinosus]|nr:hypothetical protein [Rubrivivax gelatinosus]